MGYVTVMVATVPSDSCGMQKYLHVPGVVDV